MRSSSDFCDWQVLQGIPDLHAVTFSVSRGELYVAMDQEYILASKKELTLNLEQ
jgi:hypothetical protein